MSMAVMGFFATTRVRRRLQSEAFHTLKNAFLAAPLCRLVADEFTSVNNRSEVAALPNLCFFLKRRF